MDCQVLLVEDDIDICEAVRDALLDAGYEVAVAGHGGIAMSALQTANEPPCVILLDLMMPVMDGEQFLRQLRQDARYAGVPVVVVSADCSAPARAAGLGATEAVVKPVPLRELLAIVSRYCSCQ